MNLFDVAAGAGASPPSSSTSAGALLGAAFEGPFTGKSPGCGHAATPVLQEWQRAPTRPGHSHSQQAAPSASSSFVDARGHPRGPDSLEEGNGLGAGLSPSLQGAVQRALDFGHAGCTGKGGKVGRGKATAFHSTWPSTSASRGPGVEHPMHAGAGAGPGAPHAKTATHCKTETPSSRAHDRSRSRRHTSFADEAAYNASQLVALTRFRQQHRRTNDGRLCAAAFVHDHQTYTQCTDVTNAANVSGREWCYVEPQLLNQAAGKANWDYCQDVVDYEDLRSQLDAGQLGPDETAAGAVLDIEEEGGGGSEGAEGGAELEAGEA